MAGTTAAGMAGAVTATSSATAVIVIMLDLSCHNGGMREEIGMLILVKAALLQIRPAADRRLGFAVMADDQRNDSGDHRCDSQIHEQRARLEGFCQTVLPADLLIITAIVRA